MVGPLEANDLKEPISQIGSTTSILSTVANGGKRMRRIGIVAVARRLLIDLWRYLEYDKIPEGARLKSLA